MSTPADTTGNDAKAGNRISNRPLIPLVVGRALGGSAEAAAEVQRAWLESLRAAMTECDIRPLAALTDEERATAQVALVATPDPDDLRSLPNLRWVQSLWAGVDDILAAKAAPDRPPPWSIVRMRDPRMAETMAEAVLAWTLYLHRDMPAYRRQQQARQWRPRPMRRAQACTVSILGLGAMGTASAARLRAQGFSVCGWRRRAASGALSGAPGTSDDGQSGGQSGGVTVFAGDDGLRHMLAQSDILVCLLPLTAATHSLLNHDTLAQLPRGAAVINFARGAIVDSDALIAHLDSGHLSHAVLDVFAQEPLPADSPLWSHEDITILPHIAAPTDKESASVIAASNIRQFLASGRIPESVDRTRGY